MERGYLVDAEGIIGPDLAIKTASREDEALDDIAAFLGYDTRWEYIDAVTMYGGFEVQERLDARRPREAMP